MKENESTTLGGIIMARKYQHTQELLPKIKEMLEGGMTQREVAERLGVTGERAIHHLLTRERKKELHGIPKQPGRKPAKALAESRNTYGYRRVCIWLERKGIHHNPKTILRVMNKYNLLSVIRRKRYVRYGEGLHKYPNLLNRDFTAECPNQKWVTDISYISTGQGTLYLSIIRDLYDNSIVIYKTATN